MPLKFVAVIYILSNVCCLSTVNETPLNLLKSLHRKHCSHVSLCNTDTTPTPRNTILPTVTDFLSQNITASAPPAIVAFQTTNVASTSTVSTDVKLENQCCFHCSCSNTCKHYGNCCIDKFKQEEIDESSLSRERQSRDVSEGTRFTCLTPQLTSNHVFISKAPSYYMVNTCHTKSLGNRQIVKCESEYVRDFLLDFTPVYMKNKKILYKNAHCVSCNFENVNKAVSLEPVLLCPENAVPIIMGFETPTQIIDFLRQSKAPLCNLMFKFPRNIEMSDNDLKTHECISPDVSFCNVTGQWRNYDPALNEACEKYYLPIQASVPNSTVPTVFRNLACYMCNYYNNNTDIQCGVLEDRKEVELRLHVNPSISEYKTPINIEPSSGTDQTKKLCGDGQFFDAHKKTCRAAECPIGQYRSSGDCEALFKEVTSLKYQLTVKMFVKHGTLERFAEEFRKNSGLISDLLSNFGNDSTLFALSIWAKVDGQQPMIVFHLIMTTKDTPLLYNKLLKQINFLINNDRDNGIRNYHFYIADHIYFDKGGSKAVDLTDNVELYNLQYLTPHNKVENIYPLEITEMRLCERVKLKTREYDIYDATLHLKHTRVFLYGREFIIDGKNQTFVCINKYNGKIEQTVDKTSEIEDKPGVNQQRDNSEKDNIMRDFGFFIGCLALLALFVAVALAKKKYLNKRLQQMTAERNTSSVNDHSLSTAPDENIR